MALAEWKTEDFAGAQKHFAAAATDLADSAPFLLDWYHFSKENGQLEQAVDVARKYVKLVPTDLNMQDELEDLEVQGY